VTASAQQVGDRIVVTTRKAPLRSQDDTTGTVPKGNILVIKNVNGDWFWVIYSGGKTGTVKGWINRSDVVPYSQALDFFNEELKRNPTAWTYTRRGMIWNEKGENDIAIGDFNEAIRLDPKFENAYNNRGYAWTEKKEYDKAIADFNEAIRLDPKSAIPYNNRGDAWEAKGEYDKAIADYNEAIRLDPKYAHPWDGRAWVAATCPNAKYRDGKKAVDDATKSCELDGWKDSDKLDTLAAAYAEAGDFLNAVKWEEKATELAPENEIAPEPEKSKAHFRSRLELYKTHKPYREEVKK
jgi:tetratricopeptide (TPR) repeat protein